MTRFWSEVPPGEVMDWNRRIHDAGAPLWQLPYWRAFLQRPRLRPRYFVERDSSAAWAWACVMEWGPPGYRVALVQDGPVDLADPDRPVSEESVRGLTALLRRCGYVFVRFSNAAHRLVTVSALPTSVAGDFFPFFCRDGAELQVPLLDSEDETLASFQRHARTKITRATRRGFRVRGGDDLLDQAHDMILKTATRKGFRVPSRDTLAALLRAGAAVGGIRFYVAEDADGVPVSAIVVGADRSTWHYLFGGVDIDRTGSVSPTTLLHWSAMRDAIRVGANTYNLGSAAPPSIAEFKQRFAPVLISPPVSVTVSLRPVAAVAWRWAALPALRRLWPSAQNLRNRLWQRSQGAGSEPVLAEPVSAATRPA